MNGSVFFMNGSMLFNGGVKKPRLTQGHALDSAIVPDKISLDFGLASFVQVCLKICAPKKCLRRMVHSPGHRFA